MKLEFIDYLESLGVSQILKDRVDYILKIYEHKFNITIDDICITDYVNESQERIFENLWLFNSLYLMEAKNFLTTNDFDFMYAINSIVHLQVKNTDYDFEKSNDKSRLYVVLTTGSQITGTLKTSKGNCDMLFYIFKKYLQPNIVSIK